MPANIAILIDAENVDPSLASQIFSYARSLGEVTIREIYGSGMSLNEWADPILENTIQTHFTLRPNRFKNSSDIALTIGAMEVLRAKEKNGVDAVIIASSDSDFSPLAFHLRAAGVDVIGMGEPGRINPMWPKACTEFVELTAAAPTVRKRSAQQESAPAPVPVPEEAPAKPAAPAPEKAEQPKKEKEKDKEKEKQQEKQQEKQAQKKAPAVAPTHRGRVDNIRAFILEQLSMNGGRVKSGDLFKLLNALPDYKFDQQRSRRKPLDYLAAQYGDWFAQEPGENGATWISQKPEQAPAEDAAAPQADEPAPAPADEAQPAAQDEGVSLLISIGIPADRAEAVAAILSKSRNLFAAYHGLTKAFGRKTGKEYYGIVKTLAGRQREEAAQAETPRPDEKEAGTSEADEAPATQTPGDSAAPDAVEPEADTSGDGAADEIEPEADALGDSEPEPIAPQALEPASARPGEEQYLVDKGLSAADAARVSAIVKSSPNMRVGYNELRKAFGTADARKYLAWLKEYNAD